MKWSAFFVFAGILISLQAQAQFAPELNRFNASDFKGQAVYLNWELAAGSVCNGISVLRSEDGETFTMVGDIYGVCGSLSYPVSYDFTDSKPVLNKRSFYRLEMGRGYFSDIISIEVINIQSGFHIRPNPINNTGKIYFSNDSKFEHQIQIISPKGYPVFSAITNQDFFEINAESFHAGVYLFIISTANDPKKASGRFIVQH